MLLLQSIAISPATLLEKPESRWQTVSNNIKDTFDAIVKKVLSLYKAHYQKSESKSKQPGTSNDTSPENIQLAAEELAQKITVEPIEPGKGAFGKLFDKVIKVEVSGNNIFQRTYAQVKKNLEEKSALALKALSAVGEEKKKLIEKAKNQYQEALEAANNLLSKVESGTGEFINMALKSLFDINYKDFQKAVSQFRQSLTHLWPHIEILQLQQTWQPIYAVTNNWYAVQKKGYSLYNNLGELLSQLRQRTKERDGYWGFLGYRTENTPKVTKQLNIKYPLTGKLNALLAIYPKLITSINTLDLKTIGQTTQNTLNQSAEIMSSVSRIYGASLLAKVLLTEDMIMPLKPISNYMKKVGEEIDKFTSGKPFKNLAKVLPATIAEAPLKNWFTSLAWHPVNTVNQVKMITNELFPCMIKANGQLMDAIQKTTNLSNTFSEHATNMPLFIKQNIIEELKQKPFQNYLNVAKRAVMKEAKISKDLLNDTLLYAAGIVNYFTKLMTPLLETIEKGNEILSKALLDSDDIALMMSSNETLKLMMQELARMRNAIKKNQLTK